MTIPSSPAGVLDRAVALTEGVCRLPAVAVPPWADQAAQVLTLVADRSLACVFVGQIKPTGAIEHLETAGAAAGRGVTTDTSLALTLRSTVERLSELGFEPPRPSGHTATADELIGPAWSRRGMGSAWPAGACHTLIISAHPLGDPDLERYLIAGVGIVGPGEQGSPESRRATELMNAVMPALARRALLAIGPRVSGSGRWLTDREQAVLERLALGHSVREIADEIGRSPHTVHDHVKSLHRKLDASSRGELVARALGYIDDAHRVLGTLGSQIAEPKPIGASPAEGVRAAARGTDSLAEPKPGVGSPHTNR